MTVQEFLDSLPAEQKIQALSCRSADELIAFARKAKVALPDEALADIAGGANDPDAVGSDADEPAPPCPECGSSDTHVAFFAQYDYYCAKCGYQFG